MSYSMATKFSKIVWLVMLNKYVAFNLITPVGSAETFDKLLLWLQLAAA